jgi:HAD superfamily hydrolase (TIGR01484 family)
MNRFQQFPAAQKASIRYVLTDIDDTLTLAGRLVAAAFTAMDRLKQAGIGVVPITGRPAGWCDHIARMWPVEGVVGENGAFYFRYDHQVRKMIRRYWRSKEQRLADRIKLKSIAKTILEKVPGCQVSADQDFRQADLAIDFCEDVAPLSGRAKATIVECFEQAGARAKISSIHVNGWFGDYDKLAMTRRFFEEVFKRNLDEIQTRVMFIGDSPNDAALFAYFTNSIGVANVFNFADELSDKPAWITRAEGGYGFAEMAEILLAADRCSHSNADRQI